MSDPREWCEWCNGSDNEDPDVDALCQAHLAEYECLTTDELIRRDTEEAKDLL